MKTPNTNENKARFFAQYYGQYVMMIPYNVDQLRVFDEWIISQYNAFLSLTPLSDITEKDKQKAIRFLGIEYEDISARANSFFRDFEYLTLPLHVAWSLSDFLRSRGYALPWMDLSVNDLVEYGWVELRES